MASGTASSPNSMKNDASTTATNVTRMAWLNTLTRPMLTRWRIDSAISCGSPSVGSESPSAGVPCTSRFTSSHSSNACTMRIEAGMRDSTKALPSTKKSPSVTTYTGPCSVPATCQTSALMNRKVVNNNSSGNARVSIRPTEPSRANVCDAAQPISGTTP